MNKDLIVTAQATRKTERLLYVVPGHVVGERIVVHMLSVFIRTNHIVDL